MIMKISIRKMVFGLLAILIISGIAEQVHAEENTTTIPFMQFCSDKINPDSTQDQFIRAVWAFQKSQKNLTQC